MNALDRNWHWMIVAASFMCHVVCDGITYSFGVMIPELLHTFHEGVAKTSWVTSILIGITLGFGPIAGALANHFGCRTVVILGSLIAAVGSIASCFATSILYLMFTVGVVMGAGFSLMFCPSVIIVNLHFHKRRALAVGMVVCGAGIGTFIFAPLSVYLIEQYTWRGTFIIYGAIILNGVIFGSIYRSPPKQTVLVQKSSVKKSFTNGISAEPRPRAVTELVDGAMSERFINQSGIHEPRNRALSLMTMTEYKQQLRNSEEQGMSHYHVVKPLERVDLFFSGYALDEKEGQSEEPPIELQVELLPKPPRRKSTLSSSHPEDDQESDASSDDGLLPDLVSALRRMLDLSLLKDPVYLTVALSNFLTNLGYDLPRIFLPDKAEEEMHVPKDKASWLLSIWGITSTIGRLLIGIICDHKWAIPHRLWIYNFSLLLAGAVNIVAPFLPTYNLLAAYSGVFGLSLSTYISLTSVVLVDLLGIEKLTNAFGLLLFFQGVSAVIGPPIGGAIVDASGNYDCSFIFAGICLALSGLVLFPIALRRSRQRSHRPYASKQHQPTLASIPE